MSKTKTQELKPNDLCQCKVGRNTMLVTLIAEDDSLKGGWLVRSTKTGKEMIIRDASRLTLSETSEPDYVEEASKAAKAKPATKRPPKKSPKTSGKKTSLLDVAAQVLETEDRPMGCHEIVEAAIEQNFWKPGSGKTPANTLYSSIIREIAKRGDDSRFQRSEERGKFELAE
ncbi:MAG: winged helix-turn-helix domain-containing protein [Planctomycetia bacterium]|jgi:hypothetical protein